MTKDEKKQITAAKRELAKQILELSEVWQVVAVCSQSPESAVTSQSLDLQLLKDICERYLQTTQPGKGQPRKFASDKERYAFHNAQRKLKKEKAKK